jgi:hypothetical protein
MQLNCIKFVYTMRSVYILCAEVCSYNNMSILALLRDVETLYFSFAGTMVQYNPGSQTQLMFHNHAHQP